MAAQSDRNLMKASNIGVCFGPTLMRPERESVASIVDIKYQNIIIEVMVQNMEQVCEWRWDVCRGYMELVCVGVWWRCAVCGGGMELVCVGVKSGKMFVSVGVERVEYYVCDVCVQYWY